MPKRLSSPERRKKRQFRIRKKIRGSQEIPRLSVFRSARNIYVQAVDDDAGHTLTTASTKDNEIKDALKGYPGNKEAAAMVGKALAERLKKLGVKKAVFDRGGSRYTGRVAALADAAREGGLKI
ncbi:MAG: 50S ribosomal protein L18 [bacterium]